MSLPKVTLIGTLTQDVDLRFTNGGKAVAQVRIATNNRKKNQQTGQWEDSDPTYLTGVVWSEHAEHVAESLAKGSRVIATGQLRQRSYEKDGQKRTVYEIDIEEIGPSLRYATAAISKAGATAMKVGGGWGETNEQPGW